MLAKVPVPVRMTAAAAAACLVVSGCADKRGGPIPYHVSDFGAPDTVGALAALDSTYKIAPMDTLAIRVFGMPNLTGDYQVDLRGNLSMPLIGDVPVLNYTPAELDTALTTRYGEKYLENPDISVGIKEARGRTVTVDGAVKKPGFYPVIGPMSLMQAVAQAEGLTELANARRVAIFRTIDGQRQAAAFDLVSIRRGEMKDPPIYSGDIVIVEGSSMKETQRKILQSVPFLNVFRPF